MSRKIDPLPGAAAVILRFFESDEAQGYRSRDRQFAISLLHTAFDGVALAHQAYSARFGDSA